MPLMFPKPVKQARKRKRVSAVRDPRKRMNVDWALTKLYGFHDKRSHCTTDLRLVLYGKDMSANRDIVLRRDGYKCVRCGSSKDLEIDHIESKGKGLRSDGVDNLWTLCRACHVKKHGRVPRWGER